MDFVSDTLADGRTFRALMVVDEFSRESLATEVDTHLAGFARHSGSRAALRRKRRPEEIRAATLVIVTVLDLCPKLRQTVKTQFSANGELGRGNSTEVHERVYASSRQMAGFGSRWRGGKNP